MGNEFFNETLVSEDLADAVSYPPNTKYDPELEASDASASAGTSASASASPNPSGGASSKLSNSIDDVNCEDLSGPVQVGSNDEDYLDADGNGTGCD